MSEGIDIPIGRQNSIFASYLWTDKEYTKYGRIFRNSDTNDPDSGIIPEAYEYATGEYSDTLLDDNIDALSFFDAQPTETYEGQYTAEVWICFAVNLEKLYPLVTTERATEYAATPESRKVLR